MSTVLPVAFICVPPHGAISETLTPALMQSERALEVVYIDEAPPPAALPETQTALRHVSAARGARYSGALLNAVVSESAAEHFIFIDQMTVVHPGTAEQLFLAARRFPDADLIGGQNLLVGLSLGSEGRLKTTTLAGKGSAGDVLFGLPAPFAGMLVRRRLFERIGGFRDDLTSAADYELIVRALLNGQPIVGIENVTRMSVFKPLSVEATTTRLKEEADVLTAVLERELVEELFPAEPWRTDAELALYRTLVRLACRYLECGSNDNAVDLFRSIPGRFVQLGAKILGLTTRAVRDGVHVMLELLNEPGLDFELGDLIIRSVGYALGGAEMRRELARAALRLRISQVQLRDLYPELPWSTSEDQAAEQAAVSLLTELVIREDYDGFNSFLEKLFGERARPAVALARELLPAIEKNGTAVLNAYAGRPEIESPIVAIAVRASIERLRTRWAEALAV